MVTIRNRKDAPELMAMPMVAAGEQLGFESDPRGHYLFRAMTDAIQVSKLYWRYLDSSASPLGFSESLYLATKGGGSFFGKVGSFEPGYEFAAVVLDDSVVPHPRPMTLPERLEWAVYLGLDRDAICAKYIRGTEIFDSSNRK